MKDQYASYTRDTKEPLKALAHSRRFRQAAAILDTSHSDMVLDYGCADGHLFAHLHATPHQRMVGYDPDTALLAQRDDSLANVTFFSDRQALLKEFRGAFSVIACMEVCEHMTPAALREVLETIIQLSAPDARIIFGVPIETGTSGFAKQLYRMSKGGRMGASWSTACRALASLPIQRRMTDVEWYGDHTGFDDQLFALTLKSFGFVIDRVSYLPFRWLGRLLNNEVFYTCRYRPKAD